MNRENRRRLLFEFAREKHEYKSKLFKIILNSEMDDILRVLRFAKNNFSMKRRLENCLFPKTIEDMSACKFYYNEDIDSNVVERFAEMVIIEYASNLAYYINLKNDFEEHLFTEQYEEALNILDAIERELGVSLWVCSKKMLLYEKLYGLEVHKKYVSDIIGSKKSNILINTLLEMESYFAEENTSYPSYKKEIDDYLNSIKNESVVRAYLEYKLKIESNLEFNDMKTALIFDSQLSLIDLYETFIMYKQINSMTAKSVVSDVLLEQSKDFRLSNIWTCENYKFFSYNSEWNEYYSLLEIYTNGEYKVFVEECKIYLNKYPRNFQAIILLIKAYINLGIEMDYGTTVYRCVYNIYVMNKEAEESIHQLLAYVKVVKGTSWEYKLKGFISRKVTLFNTEKLNYISSMNDTVISPNIVSNVCNNCNTNRLLQLFTDKCPITTKIYSAIYGEEHFPFKLGDSRRERIFLADYLLKKNEYDKVIGLLLDEKEQIANYYWEEKINRRLITAYIMSKNYLCVIELVSQSALKNRQMIRRINLEKLYDEVSKNMDKNIKKNIYYVVLIYLCFQSEYGKQRIAYSNYMDYNSYSSLQDVIDKEINKGALVFFMYNVCTQHLLKRDIILNPEGDNADEIRIDILRELIIFDMQNKKIYHSEIASLTKQKSIKDRIKQFNQSRIYVDIENIKKENEVMLKENFNRYLAVKEFNEDIISYDITSDEYLNDLKKIVDDMNEKIKMNPMYSQKIIILKGIITKITEEFLYNEKYGLNTFLSSRIRHGYCKNQLTTVFQDYNLLSKKKHNNSNEYLINEFWDELLPNNIEGSILFKKHLSEFTLNIENKVEEIKKVWLSIKFKEDNNAFLDYAKCINGCLIIERDQIVDYDTFWDEIIDYLWEYTETCFKRLREKIKNELMEFFLNQLSDLAIKMNNIDCIDISKFVKQICNNITLCKPQIGGKINEFANVFHKRNVTYKDFTMDELIDTCMEILSKLNSNFTDIQLSRNVIVDNIFKEDSFPYFVDIVNIILNNAIEHSKIQNLKDLEVSIIIEEEKDESTINIIKDEFRKKKINIENEEFVKITISNSIAKTLDLNEIRHKVEQIFANMKDTETLKKYSQSEGGTGLYKLYKTFQYNIHTPYSVLYEIQEGIFEITLLFGMKNLTIQNEIVLV